MKVRAAATAVALALTGLVGCGHDGGGPTAARRADRRPNFVYVVVDDLDAMTMPFWKAMPRTRQRLADRGLVFDQSFVSSPECCPSRATLLTGDYPHNTGVYDSTPPDGGYQVFADGAERDTLATRLDGAGYRTAFVGKYLNGYEERSAAVPKGWDEWFGLGLGFEKGYHYRVNHDGRRVRFGRTEQDYQTDVLARQAVGEIERNVHHDEPFLLALWPSAPHDAVPAARRDADNPYAHAHVPRGANFDEADVSDKPTWLREGQRRLQPVDLADLDRRYRMMMGSMYAVDDLMVDVLDALERTDQLDDTYVIFTSDNGYNFGAHRLPQKMAPYEESIRVPLVVFGPHVRRGHADQIVLNNDLTPTMLDLAGLPTDDLDGRSLRPLLAGRTVPWRRDFPIQYHGTYHPLFHYETLADTVAGLPIRAQTPKTQLPLAFVPSFQALRTERWLYVEWYTSGPHEYELYDLTADPHQLTNLLATPAGHAAHRAETDRLHARLTELMTCSGASCRT